MAAVQTAVTTPEQRSPESVVSVYRRIRAVTTGHCEPLETEDYVVQTMPDVSPAKWHLAHTAWFFEQFVLRTNLAGYRVFDTHYEYLFNSYYQAVGPMHNRPERGWLTRPTVKEIVRYREHVDEHMQRLLETRGDDDRIVSLTALGLNHEQQHQELMLTDIKHVFSRNPLLPTYRPTTRAAAGSTSTMQFFSFEGGIREVGASGKHFCFDNEMPRHRTLLEPYALADRLVTNGEYLGFMREGGYRRPEFWLSDGWGTVKREGWMRPLYWSESLDSEFTLGGLAVLDPAAPVCHVSYYEADAFARWAQARLPTEMEWEIAAAPLAAQGNLLERDNLHPMATSDAQGMRQMFGDVWEWTASPYAAYPGYCAPMGALGEYNGKFMCNQIVLRGGSCVTPGEHIRATYRNFFYPHTRWQFMGIRLARNL